MDNWSLDKVITEDMFPPGREPKKRDVIWASELGSPYFDRFHKMSGHKPTNDFTARSKGKFLLGEAAEFSYTEIFARAGMIVETQKAKEKCRVEVNGLLPVEGKFDAILSAPGGDAWDKAIKEIEDHPLPERMFYIDKYALPLAKHLKEKYPNGMERKLFEIKTINSQVFLSKIKSNNLVTDYFHHHLQLYTYMQSLGFKTGYVWYISKDDGSFMIVEVQDTPELKAAWIEDVKQMTYYIDNNIEPEFPEWYQFANGKWKTNFYARYSGFLTLKTGLTPEEFSILTSNHVKELNNEIKKLAKENKVK